MRVYPLSDALLSLLLGLAEHGRTRSPSLRVNSFDVDATTADVTVDSSSVATNSRGPETQEVFLPWHSEIGALETKGTDSPKVRLASRAVLMRQVDPCSYHESSLEVPDPPLRDASHLDRIGQHINILSKKQSTRQIGHSC